MSKDNNYAQWYNENYYNSGCGTAYTNKNVWQSLFNSIAEKIINNFNPRTVLDMGCAFGYLVQALREKGVEAYGIDVSEYAVSHADESIKPYLKNMSALDNLPDNFPKHFDLVVSIEMIEHLYEEDGLKVIDKMVSYADKVIISSTDDDFDDPTHFNVQKKEYWVEKFARKGYLRNLEIDATFISFNTYIFEKAESMDLYDVINHYEKSIKINKKVYSKPRKFINNLFNTKLIRFKPIVKKILKALHIK